MLAKLQKSVIYYSYIKVKIYMSLFFVLYFLKTGKLGIFFLNENFKFYDSYFENNF